MKKTIFLLVVYVLIQGCSTSPSKNTYRDNSEPRPLVDEKYRVSEDRKKFDDLRKDIPADQKVENDELSLVLQLLKDETKPPYEIKNKFDQILRKKRDSFSRDMGKEREKFTNQERKEREAFLKKADQERKSFQSKKVSKDERTEFYKTQDETRKDFLSNERERRADFESDVRERRKNFEDYARETQNSFYQEWRAYSKKYDDLKRKKNNETPKTDQNPEVQNFLQELEEARSMRSEKIESGQ